MLVSEGGTILDVTTKRTRGEEIKVPEDFNPA